jgi:hypothetical protein
MMFLPIKDNNVRFVPDGLAFANSVKARPDLEPDQRDKRHPLWREAFWPLNNLCDA